MGFSKSTSKTKQTQTTAPTDYSKPYVDAAATQLQPGFAAASANNATLLPRVNSALDYSGDVMSGKYLNGNPQLDNVIAASNRDITTGVDSRFEGAGRYGSGAHSGVLARALADNENRIRFGNYETERGYQNAAPGQIAGLTGVSSGIPQAAGSTYADQVRSLLGQYNTQDGTSVTKTSPNIGLMMLQAAAAAAQAGASASDRRLKRNITKLAELADGLGVYAWEYIWGKPAIGVMADEVEKLRPWALGPKFHGFATVNYGAL